MKTLKKFEFKQSSGRGGQQKHDWDKLFDGNIYALTEGEDFEAKKVGFAQACKIQAKRRGLFLNLNTTEDGVVLQAHGHDDKDRQKRAADFVAHQKALHAAMAERKKSGTNAESNGEVNGGE